MPLSPSSVIGGGGAGGAVTQGTVPWVVQEPLDVEGTVAAGAADSGNPVKAGGRYTSPLPTLASGQRGDLQVTSRGRLRIQVGQADNEADVTYMTGEASLSDDEFANALTTRAGLWVDDGSRSVNDRAVPLQGNTANGLDVDVTRLPALAAGTNNIGDVDVLTLPDVALNAATLAALETIGLDAATLAALETISVANFPATQPVSGTVSVTEPVSVDDNGGSLTVDGPLTDAQLRAAVVPVGDGGGALTVDGTVAVTQSTSPWVTRDSVAAMTWASVKSAAPGASAVQATTGALAAGDYDFDIYLAVSDTVAVGKGLVVEHRNAADGATLFNLGGATPNGGYGLVQLRRYTIAANERIRVIAGTAAGAASSMYVSAIGRRAS